MQVLVSNIMMLNERERFEKILIDKGLTPVFPEVNQFLKEDELLDIVGDFEGWLAGDDQITEAVLQKALPKLKVISKWGTGTDSIDKEAAKRLGIPVYNSPGAFRDAVSEVAIAYMFALSRSVVSIDRAVRNGGWPKPVSIGLTDKKLGIIGFGAIGKGIAERAFGVKMQVDVCDPYYKADPEFPTVNNKELEELAETSDYLCLACNLSADNKHMINADILKKMPSTSYLINVGRGPLVDEEALIAALANGEIAGAGLDVFEIEPLAQTSPLMKYDNVILGSHNANNTVMAVEYVHMNTLENLYKELLS